MAHFAEPNTKSNAQHPPPEPNFLIDSVKSVCMYGCRCMFAPIVDFSAKPPQHECLSNVVISDFLMAGTMAVVSAEN